MDYLERNRDFKGVWIPKEIWLNENLTTLEKIILIEVDSLDNEDHCVAGNEYLAQFCQCSEWKVSDAIKKLQALGYIQIISFDGRHRRIRSCLRKFQGQHLEIPEADLGKPKAIKINNNIDTNINIYNGETSSPISSNPSKKDLFSEETTKTNEPTPDTAEDKYSEEVKEIIAYLNEKAQTRYRASTPATRKHIVARLKQAYTVTDFKYVIDVKCAEWLGNEWEKYLRPDTLFREGNFEKYLNTKMSTVTKTSTPQVQQVKADPTKIRKDLVF